MIHNMLGHSVSRNAMALVIMQFSNLLIPILVFPYLTRVLTIESIGEVFYLLALIQVSLVLTDFGFSLYASRQIALNRNKFEVVNDVLGGIFLIKIPLVILACLLALFFYKWFVVDFSISIYFFICLAIISQAYQPIWFFQGIERMRSITIYVVISKLVYLLLVYLLVKKASDNGFVFLSWGVAQFLAMSLAILFVYREGYRVNFPSIGSSMIILKESAQFFWSRVAVMVYTSANTIMVGNFSEMNQVAYYGACDQVYKAGQAATNPVSQALYPYMSRTGDWVFFYKIIAVILLLLLLPVSLLGLNADMFLSFVFGKQYLEASSVFIVMMLIIPVNYISVTFGYPAFGALNKVHIANYSVIAGAFIHISILTFLFISGSVNALNVALTTLVTELFVLFIRAGTFYKEISKNDIK